MDLGSRRIVLSRALISCAITTQLICVFVFAYAKFRFSHDTAYYSLNHSFTQIKTGVHDLNTGYGSFCTYVTDLKTCLTPTEDKISITYEIMKDHLGLVQQFIDVCQLPGTCTIHLLANYFDRMVWANGGEQDQTAHMIRVYLQFAGTI